MSKASLPLSGSSSPALPALVTLATLVTLVQLAGCQPLPPPAAPVTSRPARPWPSFDARLGRAALGRFALRCYRAGLRLHPAIFGKGGQMVIRWHADRKGDLLHLDFVVDSFGTWEVDALDQTMAQCIVRQARAAKDAKLRWRRKGWAPLRLHPSAPARRPSSVPTSSPATVPPAKEP